LTNKQQRNDLRRAVARRAKKVRKIGRGEKPKKPPAGLQRPRPQSSMGEAL